MWRQEYGDRSVGLGARGWELDVRMANIFSSNDL